MIDTPIPQKLAERAKQVYQSGDYSSAAAAFLEAASAFSDSGDALMAAEMKNNQSVALLLAGDAPAALDASMGTEKIFGEAEDFRREGMALANQASAYDALKRRQDAVDSYHKASDALEKAGEGDMRAEIMQLLSMHYLRRFKFYDAVISLQSGLAGVKNPTPKQRFMKKILFVRI
jgi:tetratricopeptide (TPR) repeat protein